MSVISNKNLNEVIVKTLSIMNPQIIQHGQITGYILYKMLQFEGKCSRQELLDYTMLGILHDIGLYQEQNQQKVAQMNQEDPWSHSVYGFLFLKYLTPIGDLAEAVLYHHLDYNRFKLISMNYRHITECLALADQMDSYMQHGGKGIPTDYFTRYRDIKFSGRALDLFLRAEKRLGITRQLVSGAYREELAEALSRKLSNEDYKRGFLEMLVYIIDSRSEATVVHTMSTVYFAKQLGSLMKLSSRDLKNLSYGALLHDLGKIAIPLDILEAPGRLEEDQMRIMRGHVQITEHILNGLVDDEVLQIAIRHHEKLDGTGYHRGLTEKELTLPQQIMAVADILSALYGKRSYKGSFDSDRIKQILNEDADKHKISRKAVDCLMEHYDQVIDDYEKEKEAILGQYFEIKEQYGIIMKKFEHLS